MLSLSRLAVTASLAAALAVPAAAQARPDLTPSGQRTFDVKIDKVSPDARLGEPDPNTTFVSVPKTEVVEADSGFEDFRTASLDVARELWGQDSPEYTGTNESFAAVGLDGTWEAPEVEGC